WLMKPLSCAGSARWGRIGSVSVFFFLGASLTTESYTLSLHDALPIFDHTGPLGVRPLHLGHQRADHVRILRVEVVARTKRVGGEDRKSTRLNSSHLGISYAVFCLKKKRRDVDITYDTRTF